MLQGRTAEAEAVLARLARECRDDATQYRIAMARARALGGSAGLDSVLAAIEESRLRTSTERGGQALDTVRVGAFAAAGQTALAVASGLELVDAALDAEILILAVGAVAPALTVSGRTTTSLALVQRAETEIMQRPGAFPGIATAGILSAHVFALLSNGSLDECDALIELVSALPSAASGVVFRTGYLDLAQGRIALARGRPGPAIAFLTTAAAGLSGADHLGGHAWALALLGEAYALLGRRADAQRVGAESESTAQRHLQRYESDRQRALGWIDACAGRSSAAEQRLREAAATCAAREEFGLEAHLHSDLLRLGDHRHAPTRLLELADVVDGPLAAARTQLARAVSADDPSGCESAARALDELGMALEAVDAAFIAVARFSSAGLRSKSNAARRAADRYAAQCGGARTPAFATQNGVTPLTKREREVAEFAAEGLSNRDIASELSISVRTAEGHLAEAFIKLGVSDRDELKEVLQS